MLRRPRSGGRFTRWIGPTGRVLLGRVRSAGSRIAGGVRKLPPLARAGADRLRSTALWERVRRWIGPTGRVLLGWVRSAGAYVASGMRMLPPLVRAGADRLRAAALPERVRAAGARIPVPAWGYGGLFLLFALLYRVTGTRDYTFDSVSYALQIERFAETGDYHWLFHPHHVLFNVAGLAAFEVRRLLGFRSGALDALLWMNALLGAAGVALFARAAGRICRDRGAGLLAGAGLGLSYGYWTCSTDGRVNIAGVVVLAGALGVVAALLDARRTRRRRRFLRYAAALGLLHATAVLFHQSHALLAPAAFLALSMSPGRSRRHGLLAYLGGALGLGVLSYLLAARLATGASGVGGVVAFATTYAHGGQWWSWDVARNLVRDIDALVHAFVAQPALSRGAAPTPGRLLLLLLGTLAAMGAVAAAAWWALRRAGIVAPPDASAPADGADGSADSLSEVPQSAPGPGGRGVRRRLRPVLAAWVAAYAVFFTFWNPGYFVFWVPVLLPLWLLVAMSLAAGPCAVGGRPQRWLGAAAALLLLAVNNLVVAIAPHSRPEENGRLQKALAVREHTRRGDVIVIAAVGDDADAEVYLPYFARRDVIPVNALLSRASSLGAGLGGMRSEIDERLRAGRRVFVHEELLSSEGPYAALRARHGLTRRGFITFLHRHYQLGDSAQWRAGDRGRETGNRGGGGRGTAGRLLSSVSQPRAARRGKTARVGAHRAPRR